MREVTDYMVRGANEVIAQDVLALRRASLDLTWKEEFVVVLRGTGVTTVDIKLGTPEGYSGRRVFIKNGDNSTDAITVTAPLVTYDDGTTYQSKIDGANTAVLNTAYGYLEILCDGKDFHIINK